MKLQARQSREPSSAEEMARSSRAGEPGRYEITKKYWELPVDRRTWKEVARIFEFNDTTSRSSQNRLSRLAREHERLGLVKHVVLRGDHDSEVCESSRVSESEAKICDLYAVREVVVVDVPRMVSGEVSAAERDQVVDNQVHRVLGFWASRILVSVLRNGDMLAVGSGRGTFYTALALAHMNESCIPGGIVSMMGALLTRGWEQYVADGKTGVRMDSDTVGELLCRYLRGEKQVRISKSISEQLGSEARAELERAIGSAQLALVGVGGVTGQSHFIPDGDLADEVAAVVNLALELDPEKPAYQRFIGEMCGTLFVNTAAQLPALLKVSTDELETRVKKINARLLNTPPEALVKICSRGGVIAIAAGAYKAPALSHALNQRPSWISHLVIDAQLADELIKLKRTLRSGH